jgi:hypothetical protein
MESCSLSGETLAEGGEDLDTLSSVTDPIVQEITHLLGIL